MKAKVISDSTPFPQYSGQIGEVKEVWGEMLQYVDISFDDGKTIGYMAYEVEVIK